MIMLVYSSTTTSCLGEHVLTINDEGLIMKLAKYWNEPTMTLLGTIGISIEEKYIKQNQW